jgi:plasmid stability protein
MLYPEREPTNPSEEPMTVIELPDDQAAALKARAAAQGLSPLKPEGQPLRTTLLMSPSGLVG